MKALYVTKAPCSHVWIDPEVPPISREPVAPIIGDYPHMMKRGHAYRCRECGLTFVVPKENTPQQRAR
jgi:hypothetical protein